MQTLEEVAATADDHVPLTQLLQAIIDVDPLLVDQVPARQFWQIVNDVAATVEDQVPDLQLMQELIEVNRNDSCLRNLGNSSGSLNANAVGLRGMHHLIQQSVLHDRAFLE